MVLSRPVDAPSSKGVLMDNADSDFQARAERRRASYSIRRHTDLDQMKRDEYAYWQSQPVQARLEAASELTATAYAMKGVHVSRLQRSIVRSKRA